MKLVLIRHGESIWNMENKFTGWVDVGLSEKGISEAHEAGKLLKKLGYNFDICYTSVLKRAIDTLKIILDEMKLDIPILYNYKLNERHYGALQGLNKDETRKKYGEEQVRLWRRSVNVRPPKLDINSDMNPYKDSKYAGINNLPLCENLEDTIKRVVEFYNSDIIKSMKNNKSVLIVAHGNSIRGLIKYLDNLTDEEVMDLEIKTGNPILYEFDSDLKPIKHYYLGE